MVSKEDIERVGEKISADAEHLKNYQKKFLARYKALATEMAIRLGVNTEGFIDALDRVITKRGSTLNFAHLVVVFGNLIGREIGRQEAVGKLDPDNPKLEDIEEEMGMLLEVAVWTERRSVRYLDEIKKEKRIIH